MRAAWLSGLAGLALPLAPSAAHACTIAVSVELHPDDPDEIGISMRERARREAAYRGASSARTRAEMRGLLREAREGLSEAAAGHAKALVDAMIPPPVSSSWVPCAGRIVSSRFPDYAAAQDAVKAAAGDRWQPHLEIFQAAYAEVVEPCAEEMRGRLADYVAARVEPQKLARVWFEVHRLGFDQPGTELNSLYFLFPGPPLDLRLEGSVDMIGYRSDTGQHRLEQEYGAKLSAANWARLSSFLAENEDAREVEAALEAGLADLSESGLPYAGLCPQTTAPLAELVARSIENAKPLKPRVEILFDDPQAGS